MAAPVVSGAVALLLQANPTLSPDTVKARLMIGADKSGYGVLGMGDTDPCTYGAGYLDVPAALNCSYVATQPAVSPALARGLLGLVTRPGAAPARRWKGRLGDRPGTGGLVGIAGASGARTR